MIAMGLKEEEGEEEKKKLDHDSICQTSVDHKTQKTKYSSTNLIAPAFPLTCIANS
jgi:hypothetical protein